MSDFIVQVTPSLVNKIFDEPEKSKKKTRRTKPKVTREPQQPQPKINRKVSDDSEPLKDSGAGGWPMQPPVYIPLFSPSQPTNAELNAIKSVHEESLKVVERLKKLGENMAHEVTQRAKELRDKEFKLPYQKPVPCLAEKESCVNCYKEHGKVDPLKCAGLVSSYANCTRRVRQQVSSGNK